MPKAKVNNIEIEYETFGDPSAKPLLLVSGVGSQMITWDVEFIQFLVDRGFYVIRFDNRDVGLSTKLENAGEPNLIQAFASLFKGEPVESPYSLEDMADDAIGLLVALNIEKAHICGISMGGMIVQVITIRHPSRVLSLTSIMSTTGALNLRQPTQETFLAIFKPSRPGRDAYIEDTVDSWKICNGSKFPFDDEKKHKLAGRLFDRCYYPVGGDRQMLAILANGNRKPRLSSVKVPTLIIHGSEDPLVIVDGGRDTHDAILGSELLIIDGMGHNLPPEIWTRVTDAIKTNAAKA